ncbi:S-adenosyl-L-methionine-dependent methyltransferase [Zopfia rhizophila CBS 207.26]|uniref:rRNA adenine N(6)-methyltransferase n=1 Tax=Zopfia rhizophila CBS 207.26 TaxID=1314779 RepID=A0A6A6DA82_9PEZI|nr:S-adenosyl-L-methionine-dependent methyltransferase [Zopfia rhizophila CBS 207.26]
MAKKAGSREKIWTVEKLQGSEKYPLSMRLGGDNRPYASKVHHHARSKTVHVRTQIVSPDLCDDILSYMGPSLEKHKGCDILDINPGVGLWSSKVHDYLKPRSHILLEPEPETYGEFLQPLVTNTKSKYKLVTGDITQFKTYSDLIKDGYFPHQTPVTESNEPNNSLLVIGSLIWDPPLPGMGFSSLSKQLMLQFSHSAWSNDMFHAFGPARMLLWSNNVDMVGVLPTAMNNNSKYSLYMQKLSNVTEIASPTLAIRGSGRGAISRDPRYILEGVAKALNTAKRKGIELPAHRRESIHDFAEDIWRLSNGTGIMSVADSNRYLREQEASGKSTQGLLIEGARELARVEKALESNPLMFRVETLTKTGTSTRVSEEGWRISRLRASVNRSEKVREIREKLVDTGEQIHNLECAILNTTDEKKKEMARNRIEQLSQELGQNLGQNHISIQEGFEMELDDRLALRSQANRLGWDKRAFEPIVVHSDEVWPFGRVSLVDIEPKPIPEGQSSTFFEYFQDFVVALFSKPSLSLPEALEQLAPGASELMRKVPALRDPAKGGRLNMDNLRVRMLTAEMVDGLCNAYMEWPFRLEGSDHPKFFQTIYGQKGPYPSQRQ